MSRVAGKIAMIARNATKVALPAPDGYAAPCQGCSRRGSTIRYVARLVSHPALRQDRT